MKYLHWDEKVITDLSKDNISSLYEKGYVFTRLGKGIVHQTRSVRIDLNKFHFSSENKRIIKKVPDLSLQTVNLPLEKYDWKIGKLGKDFYDTKFGVGIMSVQKIKEMLTLPLKSNFNTLLLFQIDNKELGYAVCFKDENMLHYSYPFYDLETSSKDMGLAMMLKSIEYAKGLGLKHIYLGSLQRPGDTYKLQFEGLEWFDKNTWKADLSEAKEILKLQNDEK